MGEVRKQGLRVDFDASVRLEFQGATITSDAGLLACSPIESSIMRWDWRRSQKQAFTMGGTARTPVTDLDHNCDNRCSADSSGTRIRITPKGSP